MNKLTLIISSALFGIFLGASVGIVEASTTPTSSSRNNKVVSTNNSASALETVTQEERITIPEVVIAIPKAHTRNVSNAPRTKVLTCGDWHTMTQGPVTSRVRDCFLQ